MNWGPRSETISSGRPKFLKTWLNIHSPVSKAVGSPLRGINLHAFEKQSTVTRTQVLPSELGRSTTKSIPYLDQGHRGTGSGTSLPTGRCQGVFDMAQTKQLRTYQMTSRVILGHQNRTWRSERVCVLPRCPEPGILCTEPQKGLTLWCRDIGFPFWASQRSWFGESGDTDVLRDVPLDGTDDEGWRDDGFCYEWDSREYRRDKASALQLRFPGR